ncbi:MULTISPECIES: putative ABC transporter permease subunit [Virgibacillus]|uniref:ABC transporter permease n=1 Tax=Virgibacillus kapii TaxID=1638645 RepID=A0ABQ2DRY9_9BACI|nr:MULTISPECIES: hypothetical protein [Virgibacillus]EQB35091.1 hypothetical protein M948_18510 [Virgibacillus sp. CM-4]GGJ69963.1 ABC transporter permease [Virgibacillus kapii]
MMSKTWLLMRIMLKMQYSKAGKSHSQMWILLIAFIFCIPFVFLYIGLIRSIVTVLFESLQPIGQETVILGLLFISIHAILFFMSFFTIMNTFYFTEDIQSFIPFPFQPYQLLLGKATNPFLYLYLTNGFLFLPFYFIYGGVSSASIFYYIHGILNFILLPFVPFCFAAIILMIVMRFVNVAKNKDRSKVIAGIVSLAFIIFINVLIRLNTDTDKITNNFADYIQKNDGLLNQITAYYPPAYFQTKSLTGAGTWEGILCLLAVIAFTIGLFSLFLWVGQQTYLKGMFGAGNSKKQIVAKNTFKKAITQRPIWVSFIRKELRTIFRTPSFLLQCVIQSLFGPIFILIILLMDSSNEAFAAFFDNLSSKQTILLLFLASIILLGTNATSLSSISREGKNWFVHMYFPISIKQILFYKIMTAWLLNLILIGLLLIIGSFLFQLSPLYIGSWAILMFIASWLTSTFGTYLDFSNPKLTWTDEQEVFKSRFISLIALFIYFGMFGGLVLIIWNSASIHGLFLTFLSIMIALVLVNGLVLKLIQSKIRAKHQHYI